MLLFSIDMRSVIITLRIMREGAVVGSFSWCLFLLLLLFVVVLTFKKGAFLPKLPVQPFLIKYSNKGVSMHVAS